MKIYTKTGDSGTTSLFGGKRVGKDSARIEAYGNIDELNSLIGVIIADLRKIDNTSVQVILNESEESRKKIDSSVRSQNDKVSDLLKKLLRIQNELFVLGSDLATPMEPKLKVKVVRIKKSYIIRLEREIDLWDKNLAPLKKFILPGGSPIGARLHLVRTVARRAERAIVALAKSQKINTNAQIYINRLSDWLFTLARYVNKIEKIKEIVWEGRPNSK